jgi:hypothetical protein
VHRSKVAQPGGRVPLLVLVVALAAGAVMFVHVHRRHHAAGIGSRSVVESPSRVAHDGAGR